MRRRGDSEEARKALNQTSRVLFGVAALQCVCGVIGVFALQNVLGVNLEPLQLVIAIGVVVAIGVAFIGLGVWSRYQPLPPAIIGLILYLVVFISDIAMAPDVVSKGVWVRIIIVVLLVRGIAAANKYNKLQTHPEHDY